MIASLITTPQNSKPLYTKQKACLGSCRGLCSKKSFVVDIIGNYCCLCTDLSLSKKTNLLLYLTKKTLLLNLKQEKLEKKILKKPIMR